MLKFVKPSNPILFKKAKALTKKDAYSSKIKKIVDEMIAISYGKKKDLKKPVLVGLSAPQLGISLRIILVDILADGKVNKGGNLKAYLNPRITFKSKAQNEWYEGCASTDSVCGIVSRANEIMITGYDQKGNKIEERHKGYVARIFQHEIDHLEGILFISHIKDPDKLHWVEEKDFVKYRNNLGWKKWPKKCSFAKWEEIKKKK